MSQFPLVGLIGKKRAGKDTVASVFVERYGWRRLAFADPLKDASLRLDPLVGDVALPGQLTIRNARLSDVVNALGWEAAKDYVPEVRGTLQRLGTDAIRAIDEGFWLRAGAAVIDERTSPVIVTDVRFPNEADAIIQRGGVIIRVSRPGPRIENEHPTETALDAFPEDARIWNDGDLEDLLAEADRVARGIIALSN